MPNFETMKALKWKIDQLHTKTTPKTFLNSLKGGQVETKPPFPWTGDIILYILFFGTLIAFVYIIMKFAKDFKRL